MTVSTGSISNIIKEWRQQNPDEQQQEPKSETVEVRQSDRVTEGLVNNSVEDYVIENWKQNSYPVDLGHRAPLNYFTNGFSEGAVNNVKLPEEEKKSSPSTYTGFPINNNGSPLLARHDLGTGKAVPNSNTIKESDDIINQYDIKNEPTKEEDQRKFSQVRHKPFTSLRNTPNKKWDTTNETDDDEESQNKHKPLDWDPDSEEAWEKRVIRTVLEDKKQRAEQLQELEHQRILARCSHQAYLERVY